MVDEYTVLDIETTGLSKYIHNVTEIAAVKIKGKRVVGSFQTLVNPEQRIPSFITRLTGIDNEMVKDAPTIDSVLPAFLDFLGSSVIVAHNATFDYGFINYNSEKHLKKSVKNKRLCTRKLANRLLPSLPRKRLGDICECFDVKNEQAHRAMGDVKATKQIFYKFMSMLALADIKTQDEIMEFEKASIRR